jgi:hypothetical protein
MPTADGAETDMHPKRRTLFVLTRQAPAGKWGAATYALKKTGGEKP